MTDFYITQAQKNQFPQVLELLKIAAHRLKEKGINQWDYWLNPPEERLNWAREGFNNNQFYFLKHKDNIIGMYRLMTEDLLYWSKMKEAAYYIHSLVVIPEYVGQQLGSQMIEEIKNKALESNVSILRLDCNATNPVLCAYYEKLGFQKVGYIQMPLSFNNLYEHHIIH